MADQPTLPAFNDGSGNDPVVVPSGPAGSKVRRSFWQIYFSNWGAKSQSSRSAQNTIDGIRNDIAKHQDDLAKYRQYQKWGLNVDQAISGILSTITGLQLALTQKLQEDKNEGLTVN